MVCTFARKHASLCFLKRKKLYLIIIHSPFEMSDEPTPDKPITQASCYSFEIRQSAYPSLVVAQTPKNRPHTLCFPMIPYKRSWMRESFIGITSHQWKFCKGCKVSLKIRRSTIKNFQEDLKPKQYTILIVDDEKRNLSSLSRILSNEYNLNNNYQLEQHCYNLYHLLA